MARQDQANDEFSLTSFLYGGNADYIEQLQAAYEDDPQSVDPEWQQFFGALKDDAIVVNLARGELVDEDALLAFLARSPRSRYATDVTIPEPYPPDGKLGASDQIVITPHVGARREDAWQAIEASTLAIFDEEDRP
jgi:2-oxoglutarate dehydrogenase complex dehydrogenase (E1) component-like enzyme